MTRSVLRLDDQRAGRLPDRCVLSGKPTDAVARVWAVTWRGPRWVLQVPGAVALLAVRGRSHRQRVSLPVAADVWQRWHRRNIAAVMGIGIGLGFLLVGLVQNPGLAVIGAIVLVVSAAARTRAAHNYWFTCRLNTARGVVTVEPTHADFDAAARTLFARSMR